jgi:hypothetical protein
MSAEVKKKLIIAAALLLVAALGEVVWQVVSVEPCYNGKPLSYWIGHQRRDPTPEEQYAALVVLRDKAVPILIKRLRSRPSPAMQLLSAWFPKFSPLARYGDRVSIARQCAVHALGVLGPTAREAIPALEALDPEATSPFFGASVRAALASIKQEPLLPYVDKLKDTSDPGWCEAAFLMCYRGTNAVAAVPNLIAALEVTTNVNVMIRVLACQALKSIHSRPEVCVPALAPMLKSPDASERQMGLLTVAVFGSGARPLWAELTNCLGDPYPLTRETAAMLLKEIDADAASKAGVQ